MLYIEIFRNKICLNQTAESSYEANSSSCKLILHYFLKRSRGCLLEQGPGFIRVREMSGKFKIFQGQGIVREFHNLSGKNEFLLKCQGNSGNFRISNEV